MVTLKLQLEVILGWSRPPLPATSTRVVPDNRNRYTYVPSYNDDHSAQRYRTMPPSSYSSKVPSRKPTFRTAPSIWRLRQNDTTP